MTPTAAALPADIALGDGVTLRGLLWKGGSHGALLVHGAAEDLDSLAPLAEALAATEFTVLSLDRRGHGASDGAFEDHPHPSDVRAALTHLAATATGQLFVVAAGNAAPSAVAMRREPSVGGVVLLSPDSTSMEIEQLRPASEAPVLIVLGGHDAGASYTADAVARRLTGFCALARLPTPAQGSALLRGPLAGQTIDQVRLFMVRHRTR